MKKSGNIVGIVIAEKKLYLSQVYFDGQTRRGAGVAEFALPESVTLENLSTQGSAFRAFLREKGFSGKKAVVGLAGQFLLTVDVQLPAGCSGSAKNEIVRNTICRNLQYDISELAVDYCPGPAGGDSCLAVATLKKYIAEIRSLLAGAGMTAVCVTNSSLGAEFDGFSGLSCYMVMYPSAADVLLYKGGELVGFRSLAALKDAGAVGREINRIPLLYPDLTTPLKMGVLDCGGRGQDFFTGLAGRLNSVELERPAGSSIPALSFEITELSSGLARRAFQDRPFEINFVASRAAEKKEGFKILSYRKIIAALIVFMAIAAAYFYGWYRDYSRAESLQAQLDRTSEEVKAARTLIEKAAFARQWFDVSPVYLEMLRELTLQFPQAGRIWLGSLAADESLNHVITGQAADEKLVLDVYDNLKNSPRFESVKLLYIRKGTKPTDYVSYAIGFVFVRGN